MSTRDEEAHALKMARNLLSRISSGEHKINSKKELRAEARAVLKHYPHCPEEYWKGPF